MRLWPTKRSRTSNILPDFNTAEQFTDTANNGPEYQILFYASQLNVQLGREHKTSGSEYFHLYLDKNDLLPPLRSSENALRPC